MNTVVIVKFYFMSVLLSMARSAIVVLIVHFVLYTGKQTDRVKKVTFRHFLLRPKRVYKAAKTRT